MLFETISVGDGYVQLIDVAPAEAHFKQYLQTYYPDSDLHNLTACDAAIVQAARVSYGAEFKGADKDRKLIYYLFRNKHWSPFEMVSFKFRIKCDLPTRSQLMRHSSWSFNEISRRYTSNDLSFHMPEQLRTQATYDKQQSDRPLSEADNKHLRQVIRDVYTYTEQAYQYLIQQGVAREQARWVLPQGTHTELIAQANLRSLIHFVISRDTNKAQVEIAQFARAMQQFVAHYAPLTYAVWSEHPKT